MKKLLTFLFLFITLFFPATIYAAKVAVIYDSGGKFDKSFNESAYNAAEKFKADTGNEYMDFEAANNAQIEQGLRKLVDRGASVVVAMGFAMADAISAVVWRALTGKTVGSAGRWFWDRCRSALKRGSLPPALVGCRS